MFPDPCGEAFELAVANGADPALVVPDEFVVVRGGVKPLPALGTKFSASVGATLAVAAAAVPHGTIRVTTAGQIRASGGTIRWDAEHSSYGTLNLQHVNVVELSHSTFGPAQTNPVRGRMRIDGDKP